MGRVCEVLEAFSRARLGVLPNHRNFGCSLLTGCIRLTVCLQLLFVVTANPVEATRENVEAAYLFRFLNFVDFPSTSPAGASTFCLCILGDDRLSRALETSVSGKSIGNRPVSVRVLAGTHEAKSCHLLFVSGRKQIVVGELAETAMQPILTVTDLPDFRQQGEVIHLSFRDDRLRFEIDTEDAKRRGLAISSRLIQLSRSFQ